MTYRLAILRKAQKEMSQLPPEMYDRLKAAALRLGEEPRPQGCTKLVGRPAWRLRAGAYRLLYEVDDEERTVTIVHVGHRRDVYR